MAYQTHEIKVEGMTCSGCVNTLSDYIKTLPGVADFTVDLETGLVRVKTDVYKNNRQDLIKSINANTHYSAS